MRIGILPFLGGESGIYQYSITMLRALQEWHAENRRDDVVVFADEMDHPAVARRNWRRWIIRPASPPPPGLVRVRSALDQAVGEGPHREAWRRLRRAFQENPRRREDGPDRDQVAPNTEKERWFRSCGVDLMLYPAHNPVTFAAGPPYVMVIHDLQHRIHPEFPEVSANGEWELRERYFRDAIWNATLLVTDSEVGKEDVLTFYASYGATADRIKVLPFLPASYLAENVSDRELERVRAKYHLPDRFFFYPAQFWPHKNHDRIVQGLGRLKQSGVRIAMVFSGSHAGEFRERNFHDVMARVQQMSLDEEVRYLGYVGDEDMSGLYAAADALIMPTFFGPTNIPVLEAWAIGCPVLTSDIRGVREQAGDAAVLVDPRSVDAIADGMRRLWTDGALRLALAQRGRDRLALYTPADFRLQLADILKEAKGLVSRTSAPSLQSKTKAVIKGPFHAIGLDIVRRAPTETEAPAAEPERDTRFLWLSQLEIRTIVDIGAHYGEFARRIHDVLPQASILSFEPLEDSFRQLRLNMRDVPRFRSFNFGLGDVNARMEFHRNQHSDSSSLLKMTELHKTAFPYTVRESAETVEVRRLDDVLGDVQLEEAILIKIDVQGYEDRVIAGGENVLSRARLVIIETSFRTLYEGQPLFDDIYRALTQRGFQYVGCLEQLLSPADGTVLQADAMFQRL